jgi:hypothetical protein
MFSVFFNLFSRKKKIAATAPAGVDEPSVVTPSGAAAVSESAEPAPVPVADVAQAEVEQVEAAPADATPVNVVQVDVADVVSEPIETPPVDVVPADKPRPAKATSPRTSTAKVAPPKATPATRPGSKPAAKPVAGSTATQKPASNRLNKPTRQGLLDAVANAAAEPLATDASTTAPHLPAAAESFAIAEPFAGAQPTSEVAVAPENTTQPAQRAAVPPPTATSLATLTVPQLRLRAKEVGLVGYSRLPKAELLRVINDKLASSNTSGPADDSRSI